MLALGRLTGDELSADRPLGPVHPVALIVLRQRLRPEAAQTLRYLTDEGVALKVMSGDNAASVGGIATALHLPGAVPESAIRTWRCDWATLTAPFPSRR